MRNATLDNLLSQQAQCPVGVACRRLAQAHRHALGLLLTIQQFRGRWRVALRAFQRGIEPLHDQSLANILDGPDATIKSLRNVRVFPMRSVRIGFEKNLSSPNFLGRPLQLSNNLTQELTFTIRSPDDILLVHLLSSMLPVV